MPPVLTDKDYENAANELGCDVPSIKAVAQVESNGSGFLPDGRLRILFEAHIFSQRTKGKWDKIYPNISSPKWDRSLYKGGEAEHDRMFQAQRLNPVAAWESTSWGKFQIMGFNFVLCGFTSAREMIDFMHVSEANQLTCFVRFLKNKRLDESLRNHEWEYFANGYNGSGYRQNKYDEKLKAAYEKEVLRCGPK